MKSDNLGRATFLYEAPANGQTWVVTMSVPGAPGGAIFTLSLPNGNVVDDWVGKNTYGPVTIEERVQAQVKATGLVPSTQYRLNVLGSIYTSDEEPPVSPAPLASNTLTTTQFLAVSGAPVTTSQTWALSSFALPPGVALDSFHAMVVHVSGITPSGGGQVLVEFFLPSGDSAFTQTIEAASTDGQYSFPIPLMGGELLNCSIEVLVTTTPGVNVDIVLDQEPQTPLVLIGGVMPGLAIPIAETVNQPPLAAQRAGGSGAGSTSFGPVAGFLQVTSIVLGYAYSTVTLASGQLVFAVQDGGGVELVRLVLNGGETGSGSVEVTYPPDGIPAQTQLKLVVSGSITTLTGQAFCNVSYRV